LAILGYHIQILLWMLISRDDYQLGRVTKSFRLVLPALAAGVAAYFLLPYLIKISLEDWLIQFGLGNRSFYLMVGYFGLIHPFLEQRHWRPLCEKSFLGHVLFAGYHVLVLVSLMPWYWVISGFLVLFMTSLYWSWLYRREENGLAGTLSHLFADFGMILAVLMLVYGCF